MNQLAKDLSSQNEFISRKCPSCEGGESDNQISSKIKAETLPYCELKKYWMGFFREPIFFSYYRCINCDLLYNKKFFSNKKLSELYSRMPDNTAGQDLNNLRKTQSGYFEFFKKAKLPTGDYLELGPDIGLFSKNIANKTNFTHCYFVEPNKSVHAQLEKVMTGKEITISTDLFDLSAIPEKSIAAAVMIHVADHMIDPKEMIKKIHSKLIVGGVILIVTHDEKSLLASLFKSRWPAFCLQHPQLFNVKTTAKFLSSCGFEKIKSKKSLNYFSLPYLLQHLLWSLGLGQFQFKEIPWLTIPLRLGNIMTIAKKS
jgi:hypothetical protein